MNSKHCGCSLIPLQCHTQTIEQERLSTRGTPKVRVRTPKFRGNLTSKELYYIVSNIGCPQSGLTFECTAAAAPNDLPGTASRQLLLEVTDSPVTRSPESNPNTLHNVGDFITITCSAVLSGITTNTTPIAEQVEWNFQTKDSGSADWEELEEEVAELIQLSPIKLVPCRGGNTTVRLPLVLRREDHQRTYRCAYKNLAAGKTAFDYVLSQSFDVGLVRERRLQADLEERQVIYTLQSLIGMIVGILSFLVVSCLGVLYTYRKNRGGKKYDIVTNLLAQEEEELDKIEARLGVVAAQTGVSQSLLEEPSAIESSVVESSVVESSVAEPESSAVEETSVVE